MAVDRFPVEAGHILVFARAIGDPNPAYTDPDAAVNQPSGAVVAPPTFPQASVQFDPDYRLRLRPDRPWFGSGREPSGDPDRPSGTGMHAEQHYEYHRPPRAGDVLHTVVSAPRTWTREGRRGGTMQFSEVVIQFLDQHDEPVVTSRKVTVRTSRPVSQEES
jgi:acyl dehydratase